MSVSFETGEQDSRKIYFPSKVKIRKLRGHVIKAIAGSNAGTITPKNSAASTLTNGVITCAASDPLDTQYTATPTANQTIEADDYLQLVMAKSTAGGKVLVMVEYEEVR